MTSRSKKRMEKRLCPGLVKCKDFSICFSLLLLFCCFYSLPLKVAGNGVRFAKLGVQDVHDEQSVQDRLKVAAVIQRLQAAASRIGSQMELTYSRGNGLDFFVKQHGTADRTEPVSRVSDITPSSFQRKSGSSTLNLQQVPGTVYSRLRETGAERRGTFSTQSIRPQQTSLPKITGVLSTLPQQTANVIKSEQLLTEPNAGNGKVRVLKPNTAIQHAADKSRQLATRISDTTTATTSTTFGRFQILTATAQLPQQKTFRKREEEEKKSRTTRHQAKEEHQVWEDGGMASEQGRRRHDGSTRADSQVQATAGLLFQGDIMLSVEEAEKLLQASEDRSRWRRKVIYSREKRWTLPIPYMFDQSTQYKLNRSEMEMVQAAIAHLEDLTCITFRQVNASDPVRPILSFKKDAGCWSYVGKEHAFHFQEVSTGEGCFQFGTLLHELGHAIGFWHEHSRPDRDAYIRIHREHVRLGEEFNFNTESWGELDNMNVPYDVSSIMHYGSTYFSRSGQELTVEALDSRLQRVLGQRLEMSFYDIKLANRAYCSDVCAGSAVTGKCQHEGYPDPKKCDRCRCATGLTGSTCEQVAHSATLTCGGRLSVSPSQTYSISSPSYPWLYPANLTCTWLIEAGPGLQVVVRVNEHNFMTHPDCSSDPTTVCTDYLEIKYNVSFGYTGARYCCGLPPQGPLRSSGSSMLILFRTGHSGQGGFQADITAEPCGGCQPGPPALQPPCRKTREKQCVKTWNSSHYVTCPVYFTKTSPDCNTWVVKQNSRLAVCSSEMEYCCDGYHINDGFCQPFNGSNSSPKPVSSQTLTNSETESPTDIEQDADGTWSKWSPWQPCSHSCGGCGVQSRQRSCDLATKCGGQAVQAESRTCNTFLCPELLVYMCTKTRVKESFCGWGKCYRQVTETGPCYSSCCPGYEEEAGKCVPRRS